MPEVVTTFMETKQIGKVLAVQRRIVEEYKADMVKYAPAADKSRIRECFESIPAQLAREYKKFSYTVVRSGGRGRDYAGSLQWIEDAGIIRRCYNTEITELPLDGHKIKSEFKVYMSDIEDSEWQRERMQRIRMLEQDLPYYRGQYNEAENKINEYFKDFEMFLDAIDSLSNVKTNINCGVDNLQNGLIVVNRYSEGNQHDNAMGVINDVKRLFEHTSSGVEALKTIIRMDIKQLARDYVEEYAKYLTAMRDYNDVVVNLNSLGCSYSYLDDNIKRETLY